MSMISPLTETTTYLVTWFGRFGPGESSIASGRKSYLALLPPLRLFILLEPYYDVSLTEDLELGANEMRASEEPCRRTCVNKREELPNIERISTEKERVRDGEGLRLMFHTI